MRTKRILSILAVCVAVTAFTFCKKPDPYYARLADSKEVPVLPDEPIDYPNSQNDYLAALGRVLFYDKELSANKNIACASCHMQEHGFADDRQFSLGTTNLHTKRNSPSIFARNSRLFWDGRSNSMQDLVFRPVRDEVEMNVQDIRTLVNRLKSIDYYANLFPHAFPGSTKIDSNMIQSALTEFLNNFNFSNSKFRQSRNGSAVLNDSEKMGENLFFGSAKCAQCHHIDNNGFNGGGNSGYGNTDESHNIGLDVNNPDLGVGAITGSERDKGAFMMPVLLNIAFTAPYMHDGRFKTLEEVVEHYNSEVKNNPNLDLILRENHNALSPPQKLNLSAMQKKGLVDFLKTLSDPTILTDARFSNPFVPR